MARIIGKEEIGGREIAIIEQESQRVLTTQQLATGLGTDTNHIKVNFSRNKSRFEPGKHYYKLEGAELQEFKNQVTDSNLVKKGTSSLTLWTERGAARMAKILNTDEAWDLFEILEENYFDKKNTPQTQIEILQGAINVMAEQERRLRIVEEQQRNLQAGIDSLREELGRMNNPALSIIDGVGSIRMDVRQWVNAAHRAYPDSSYEELYSYLYDTVESRGRVKLGIRLENKKRRARLQGVSETEISEMNKLSVIDDSPSLREICRLQMARLRQQYDF
jgi:hypothetical protein